MNEDRRWVQRKRFMWQRDTKYKGGRERGTGHPWGSREAMVEVSACRRREKPGCGGRGKGRAEEGPRGEEDALGRGVHCREGAPPGEGHGKG